MRADSLSNNGAKPASLSYYVKKISFFFLYLEMGLVKHERIDASPLLRPVSKTTSSCIKAGATRLADKRVIQMGTKTSSGGAGPLAI